MNDEKFLQEDRLGQTPQTGMAFDLKQARKQFSRIGLVAFLGSLLILIVQYAATAVVKRTAPELIGEINSVFLISMLPMYLIAMPVLLLMLGRIPAQKIEKKKMKPGHLILSFFMCYTLIYISNLIGTMLTMAIGIVKGSAVQNTLVDIVTDLNPVLSFLFMVMVAPVMEELIFRKFLVERMVQYGQGAAVLVSAFMFGMYHGNLNQLVYAFTLGLFFAFIYVKTGKLVYTILLHMAINFLGSIVGPFILKLLNMDALIELSTMTDPKAMMGVMAEVLPGLLVLMVYFVLLLGVVITGLVLLLVNSRKFVLEKGKIELPKGKGFTTIFVNMGMILFIIYWGIIIIESLMK